MIDNSVKPLVVDGVTLPMHSAYLFELQKVYVEDPSRTNTGAIPVFPEKFFVPYFTITWQVITVENYKKILKLTEKDENIVTYYDSTDNSYKTAKFYAQQPTFQDLYSLNKNYYIVRGLQIVFAGTLNDVGNITVEYNVNGGIGTIPSQTGLNGEEFIVNSGATISRMNYVLESWNTAEDGSGETYKLGQVASFTSNLTLYAQWVKSDSYTLSLAYNYGTPAKDSEQNEINSIAVKYKQPISGLPTDVIVLDPNNNEIEFKDSDGNSVFSFVGWNKISQNVGEGTYISNGSIYDIDGNSTVYAHFDIRKYTLTFDSQEGTQIEPITAEYGATISLPKPTKEGYTFKRWYYNKIEEGETSQITFNLTIMPAENLTLVAEWELKE